MIAGESQAPPVAVDLREEPLRGRLRTITVAWIFGAFWISTISGAALTKFQISVHTPAWAYGILAAMPFASNLFQIPASILQTRLGRRKAIFMLSVTFGRLMWAVAAAIPWILPNHPDLWWKLMIGCLFLGWAGNNAGSPAWMDWMADVIPKRLRGRFFATRNRIGQIVTFVATLCIGVILDWASAAQSPGLMLKVTSAILAVAGLMGALDILRFRKIEDPHKAPPSDDQSFWQTFGQPLHDAPFRRYLVFTFLFNLAIGFIGQYIWLYALEEIHLPSRQANLMLIAIPAVVCTISYGFWGRFIDRLGKKPVLIIAGVMIVNGSWCWILIGHGAMPVSVAGHTISLLSVIGYSVAVMAMFCWPGFEVANLNILLGLAGTSEGRRNGSAYVAIYSLAVALGGVLSGLIGAAVAGAFEEFRWLIPGLGIFLTYHGLLLLISAGLRIVAVLWALGLHEPRAVPTRDALRYVTVNIYSNAVEVLQWPTRLIREAYRVTYRFSPRRPAPPKPGGQG